jgi:hypothetical protein
MRIRGKWRAPLILATAHAAAPDPGQARVDQGQSSFSAHAAYQVTEYWYTHDAENRIGINNGQLGVNQYR